MNKCEKNVQKVKNYKRLFGRFCIETCAGCTENVQMIERCTSSLNRTNQLKFEKIKRMIWLSKSKTSGLRVR